MLTELHLSQYDAIDIRKRWFQDSYFDLFVWQDEQERIVSFQLCYDRSGQERVISWDRERGFGHHRVDDGEASPHKNMSPVFVSDGVFSAQEVLPKFAQAGQQINPNINAFIMQKLTEYVHQHEHRAL